LLAASAGFPYGIKRMVPRVLPRAEPCFARSKRFTEGNGGEIKNHGQELTADERRWTQMDADGRRFWPRKSQEAPPPASLRGQKTFHRRQRRQRRGD
jgi:hypothetical protein